MLACMSNDCDAFLVQVLAYDHEFHLDSAIAHRRLDPAPLMAVLQEMFRKVRSKLQETNFAMLQEAESLNSQERKSSALQ